jgi:hypothetical protein
MAVAILLRFQKKRPAAMVRAVIQRTSGGAVTTARRPRSSPTGLFGARGSLMGFFAPMMVAELRADRARTGLPALFGLARKDSRDDAFGGIAGAVSCNRFGF